MGYIVVHNREIVGMDRYDEAAARIEAYQRTGIDPESETETLYSRPCCSHIDRFGNIGDKFGEDFWYNYSERRFESLY